jgi:hypothetical protein
LWKGKEINMKAKTILPVVGTLSLFVSPWINFLLVKNAMLADPTLHFDDLRSFVWGIQGIIALISLLCWANEGFNT